MKDPEQPRDLPRIPFARRARALIWLLAIVLSAVVWFFVYRFAVQIL